MRVLFILNASKRKIRRIPAALSVHKSKEDNFEHIFTKRKGHAIEITLQNAGNFDVIVPVGGDGTIHECVNGMMQFKMHYPEKQVAAIAPWPMGSGNDFARNFQWTSKASDMMERLQSRTTKTIDVGSVQFEDGQTRYFINELSMGLGPDVVRMIEKFPRLFPGKLKFAFAILITFLYYKRKRMDVQGAGFLHQDNTMAFVVSNGKYFGSGIGISPEAELNDGLLNVTIIGNVSLFDYLRQLGTLKRCEKVNHPKVSYHVLENLQILTQGSMETDGELSAPAPAKIQIIKSVLEIL